MEERPKILLLDDDPDLLEVYKEIVASRRATPARVRAAVASPRKR